MQKIKTTFAKKYLYLVVIGVVALVMLEALLFLWGRYLLWQRTTKSDIPETIRIVCVGDSHTFGVGTSVVYSYPAQLEKLLNLNNPNQKFSVVNLGIPGASTRYQFKELRSFLNTHDAKLIILLTGRNNALEVNRISKEKTYILGCIKSHLQALRSFKFLRLLFKYLFKKDTSDDRIHILNEKSYAEYMNLYLQAIRKLCADKSAKLVILSYYNSSDTIIKEFADRYSITYIDFTADFNLLFKAEDKSRFLSPDLSHLNRLGYKFFAEQLYNYLFFNQEQLGMKLNPLLEKIKDTDFYKDVKEIEYIINLQQKRIEENKNDENYPFELVHLGHIYVELGNDTMAKECYLKALIASNYCDNNTLVSPIINWYLKKRETHEALKICEEILQHNPQNSIARYYKQWLSSNL
ncbi:MAG: SGNH/GDSL hydrolase family protein [Candidatus Omnitrophica bacterium]|nr:SGNH/GDSL hydrolase family protein [Candidatus Omnitrophota bacterium]